MYLKLLLLEVSQFLFLLNLNLHNLSAVCYYSRHRGRCHYDWFIFKSIFLLPQSIALKIAVWKRIGCQKQSKTKLVGIGCYVDKVYNRRWGEVFIDFTNVVVDVLNCTAYTSLLISFRVALDLYIEVITVAKAFSLNDDDLILTLSLVIADKATKYFFPINDFRKKL